MEFQVPGSLRKWKFHGIAAAAAAAAVVVAAAAVAVAVAPWGNFNLGAEFQILLIEALTCRTLCLAAATAVRAHSSACVIVRLHASVRPPVRPSARPPVISNFKFQI